MIGSDQFRMNALAMLRKTGRATPIEDVRNYASQHMNITRRAEHRLIREMQQCGWIVLKKSGPVWRAYITDKGRNAHKFFIKTYE